MAIFRWQDPIIKTIMQFVSAHTTTRYKMAGCQSYAVGTLTGCHFGKSGFRNLQKAFLFDFLRPLQ